MDTRIVATLPPFYATWRTRSVTLAIAVHLAPNLIGDTLASIPVVLMQQHGIAPSAGA